MKKSLFAALAITLITIPFGGALAGNNENRIFEEQTGITLGSITKGTSLKVKRIVFSNQTAPWVIKIDITHPYDGKVSPETELSAETVSRILNNIKNDNSTMPILSEGVADDLSDFITDTKETVSQKMSAKDFLEEYNSAIGLAMVNYSQNGDPKIASFGVQWKLLCDSDINLVPAESRTNYIKAVAAMERITQAQEEFNRILNLIIKNLSKEDRELFEKEKALPYREVKEGSIADTYTAFGERFSIIEIKTLCGITAILVSDTEKTIYIDREMEALKKVLNSNSRLSALLFGQDHTLEGALEEMKTQGNPINFIQLG